MRVIDLFCGCGGLSKGFENAGYNIVAAYDNWDAALLVYKNNFSHKVLKNDIKDISINELLSYNSDMIIGGPPCQDFSSAGKRDESLGRGDLTIEFARVVSSVLPNYFVMENVDCIVKSSILKIAKKMFKDAKYGLTEIVLDASLCNVPQKRKRFFLIGELDGKDDFLKEALLNNLAKKSMSVREYLNDEFNIQHYYRHPRSYQRRGIFSIDEPSPTIRGVNRPIPPNYKFHSSDTTKDLSKVRPLTTKERARIQTFPINFILPGSKTNLEQIIGNAVPVNLAQYVAKILKDYIKK